MAHITSRLDLNSSTLQTNPVARTSSPQGENKRAQEEKKELKMESSAVTELKAEGRLNFGVFAQRICVFRSFPNHLLLISNPFRNSNYVLVMSLASSKAIVLSWPGIVVGLKENQQGLEAYKAVHPLKQTPEEKQHATPHQAKTQAANPEGLQLFEKIQQLHEIKDHEHLPVAQNPAMVELYNGELPLATDIIEDCKFLLPLPEETKTKQICLGFAKQAILTAVSYLKDDNLVVIEANPNKTPSIKILALNEQEMKILATITSLDKTECADMGLSSLANGNFLSYGGKHGIKLWRRCSSGALEFKPEVLLAPPAACSTDSFGIKLLKFGYLAYFYQEYLSASRKFIQKVFIMDIHAPKKPPIKVETPEDISVATMEQWRNYLIVSNHQYPSHPPFDFSFYSLRDLMQAKQAPISACLFKRLPVKALTKLVLDYCDEDFDTPPKEAIPGKMLGI